MVQLHEFDQTDYERHPIVENLAGEIVPMIARPKLPGPEYADLVATLLVDGNGIQVLLYSKDGKPWKIFCKRLVPFPFAVFVARNLPDPLDPEVLRNFGFERFM
jgi:hypothetical protein